MDKGQVHMIVHKWFSQHVAVRARWIVFHFTCSERCKILQPDWWVSLLSLCACACNYSVNVIKYTWFAISLCDWWHICTPYTLCLAHAMHCWERYCMLPQIQHLEGAGCISEITIDGLDPRTLRHDTCNPRREGQFDDDVHEQVFTVLSVWMLLSRWMNHRYEYVGDVAYCMLTPSSSLVIAYTSAGWSCSLVRCSERLWSIWSTHDISSLFGFRFKSSCDSNIGIHPDDSMCIAQTHDRVSIIIHDTSSNTPRAHISDGSHFEWEQT